MRASLKVVILPREEPAVTTRASRTSGVPTAMLGYCRSETISQPESGSSLRQIGR